MIYIFFKFQFYCMWVCDSGYHFCFFFLIFHPLMLIRLQRPPRLLDQRDNLVFFNLITRHGRAGSPQPSQPCSALALSPSLRDWAGRRPVPRRLPPPHSFVSAHSPLLAPHAVSPDELRFPTRCNGRAAHLFGEMLQRVFSLWKCDGPQEEQAKLRHDLVGGVCHGPSIQQHEQSYV
jgi:hypothetical protein